MVPETQPEKAEQLLIDFLNYSNENLEIDLHINE